MDISELMQKISDLIKEAGVSRERTELIFRVILPYVPSCKDPGAEGHPGLVNFTYTPVESVQHVELKGVDGVIVGPCDSPECGLC